MSYSVHEMLRAGTSALPVPRNDEMKDKHYFVFTALKFGVSLTSLHIFLAFEKNSKLFFHSLIQNFRTFAEKNQ